MAYADAGNAGSMGVFKKMNHAGEHDYYVYQATPYDMAKIK